MIHIFTIGKKNKPSKSVKAVIGLLAETAA